MVLFTLTMIVASILSFVQCGSPRALCETVPGAKCWDASVQAGFATFGGAYSAFLDFALALLPLGIVRGLTMSRKRKGALTILLGAGILYVAAQVLTLLWPPPSSVWHAMTTC